MLKTVAEVTGPPRRKVASGDVICEDCGETNKPGTEFCLFCGAYLGWQSAPDKPSVNEVTQPLQQTASAPPPAAPARPASPSPLAQPGRAAQSARPTPAAANPGPAQPVVRQSGPAAPPQIAQPSMPATAAMAAVAPAGPVVAACPTCGRTVADGRRFCAHCGHQFIGPGAVGAPATRPPAKRDTWWSRLWNRRDRASRRAFRRSLPPVYRWRRLIIILLALGLIGGGLTLINHSPKRLVMAGYYDIKKSLVVVKPVAARTIPPDTSAQGTTPAALVDNTKAAWLMNWTDSTVGSPCGSPPTTSVLELGFDQARIREIDFYPGLSKENPNRLQQFRPKDIWIAYGDTCLDQTLDDTDLQKVTVDTKVAVGSIRFGVKSAYPPAQPAGAQPVLGFTEIRLLSRPRS